VIKTKFNWRLRLSMIAGGVLAIANLSCASVGEKLNLSRLLPSGGAREFHLEPRLTRFTGEKEFFGYRRMHRATPWLVGDAVVIANAIDGVVKYDANSGREIWRYKVDGGVEGGVSVADQRVYFGGGDGQVVAVDLNSGKELWKFAARAEILSAPSVAGDRVYVQTGADVVLALERESGRLAWLYNRQMTGNLSIRSTSQPTVHQDRVYAGFADGFVVALRARDGAMQWERKLGKASRFRDVDATPVIRGQRLFTASFDGSLVALNLESGEVSWQVELGGYTPVRLHEAESKLYFSTHDGRLVELDESSGKVLRELKLKRGMATRPTISPTGNLMVFGESEGRIQLVNLENFQSVASYATGEGVVGEPVFDRQRQQIWVMSLGGNLLSLKLDHKKVAERFPWTRARNP